MTGEFGTFPKVTIYVVNHNYGRFIEQSIESVLSQTFQDFELLVIDNGSTDGSREIIERYAQHNKVVTLFQPNIGLSRTNNTAIDRSTGRYVMRLDADDYLHRNALEVLVGTLDRRPDVGLVFPDYFLVDAEGSTLDLVQRHDFDEVTLLDQPAHGACTMIRRECLEELDGYDESYHCQDGWDIWVRFIRRFGVANVNLPLFYYRQHGLNLTRDEEMILTTRADILEKAAMAGGAPLSSIAVIPIRGPAIDPRTVALRLLNEKAVLEWTVDAALAARRISQVVVASSDESIEQHVRQVYGDRVIFVRREWHTALPDRSLDETMTQVFDYLPMELRTFDATTLLFVESPFRGFRHIDSAVDAMEVFGCNRVIGVRRLRSPLYCHEGNGMVPFHRSRNVQQEKQELYGSAGDIMVIRRGSFVRDTDEDESIGHIELDELAAHRILSPQSWAVAEALAEKKPLR